MDDVKIAVRVRQTPSRILVGKVAVDGDVVFVLNGSQVDAL